MNTLVLPPEAQDAVQQLRAFYRELFDVRQSIDAGTWHELSPVLSADVADVSGGTAARAVFARLYRAITDRGFGPRAGHERDRLVSLDVGYVMAAMADEVLLHGPSWPGQDAWAATLLEEALYGTRIAGERIFRTAREIVASGVARPALAASILLSLMLGFRGRYYGMDDHGDVMLLRKQLFQTVFHGPYSAQADPSALLVDRHSAAPLNQPSGRLLPPLRQWIMALLLIPLVYVFLTFGIWRNAVSGIISTSNQIISISAERTR